MLPGFQAEPPGIEVCGVYDIVFVAALEYNSFSGNADMKLRRVAQGKVKIFETASSNIAFPIFSGRIDIPCTTATNEFFGAGYNILGYGRESIETTSYTHKPTNSCTIKTHRNNNVGRLYVVSERKAFRKINREQGEMADGPTTYESQAHEALEAERICSCRHFSFLCRDLGLPCNVCTLVTRFVEEDPEFIFAEPRDIWIDIRLSTPNRTYVLARKRS